MSLFDGIRINRLLKSGYNKEQIKAITYVSNRSLLNYIDSSYDVQGIYDVGEFLNSEYADIIYGMVTMSKDKKLLIIRALNKHKKIKKEVINFILDMANNYDTEVLKVVLNNMVNDEPDMNFMNLVKTAIDQNINLSNLKYFEEIYKEKGNLN